MRTSVVPHLPLEIYFSIFDNLHGKDDRATLLCLCLVAAAISAEAQRVLYQQFWSRNQTTRLLFLRTIAQKPRLASYVRDYAVDGDVMSPQEKDLTLFCLRGMLNLKKFEFVNRQDPNIKDREMVETLVASKCCLETLIWVSPLVEDDHSIFHLLKNQCHITELFLDVGLGLMPTISIPSGAVPNLRRLHGNGIIVKAFLDDRNIQHITWFHQSLFAQSVEASISGRLGSLTSLVLLEASQLRALAPFLPNLEVLGLHSFRYSDVEIIRSFSRLHRLVLYTSFGCCEPSELFLRKSVREKFVSTLAGSCKHLKRIDVRRTHTRRPRFETWFYSHAGRTDEPVEGVYWDDPHEFETLFHWNKPLTPLNLQAFLTSREATDNEI